MPTPTLVSAEDLPRLSPPDKRTELVRGVMIVSEPPGFRHGVVATKLIVLLSGYANQRDLGLVLGEAGYKLETDPDTVRGPDVSFVRRERVPDPLPKGYPDIAPDLAVEVLSPNDRPGRALAKVADYLNAGSRLAWVVDPERRLARVYRADGTESLVSDDGALDGEDVIPGFTVRLAEVL